MPALKLMILDHPIAILNQELHPRHLFCLIKIYFDSLGAQIFLKMSILKEPPVLSVFGKEWFYFPGVGFQHVVKDGSRKQCYSFLCFDLKIGNEILYVKIKKINFKLDCHFIIIVKIFSNFLLQKIAIGNFIQAGEV